MLISFKPCLAMLGFLVSHGKCLDHVVLLMMCILSF